MFNYVLKDIKKTRKSIENNRIDQQKRLREFDKKYAQTLRNMEERNSEFKHMNDEVNKELSRHF